MSATQALTIDTSWANDLPEMDDHQTGALRRILNLSAQYDGDWSGMLSTNNVGEDFGALRFQIGYMAYALALAHVHRLPAAPGVFQKPFTNLIRKLLSPDCWLYWTHVSTAGGPFNKSLGERSAQYNPIERDNIMYSAYLQSMALLYHYLFRDDRYALPGSLTVELKTLFWRQGGFRFPYDERSLNELIYWQMSEQGFLGVACEPNCIFQICNQPSIIGFRMHDLIYGGNLARVATEGYVRAWEEFGMLNESGNFTTFVQAKERAPVPVNVCHMHFWLMALLHSWYPEIVERQYPHILKQYLRPGPGGTQWIEPRPPMHAGPNDPWYALDMSWAAACASELGDTETLQALLGYADRMLNATWQDGAYYYKRRDQNFDADGYFIGMDPHSGNTMFSYARLNVKDGLKKLYEGPLNDQHFSNPALMDLPGEVDVRRALFDEERKALAITLGVPLCRSGIVLKIQVPLGGDLPVVFQDGQELRQGIARTAQGLELQLDHDTRTTLVLQW